MLFTSIHVIKPPEFGTIIGFEDETLTPDKSKIYFGTWHIESACAYLNLNSN